MASKYPPYVNAYGKISDVLEAIKAASVPPKFTNDFIYTVLGLKSTSYRAMVPLLKNLGFLDQTSVPTQIYKDYRDDAHSKTILGAQVKEAYKELFQANEYAHKLKKEEVRAKLKTVLGVSDDDPNLPNVVGTFLELVKFSDFEGKGKAHTKKETKEEKTDNEHISFATKSEHVMTSQADSNLKLGISYTINLNLPATTEIEVFNAIFKSLKENLLKNE